MMNTLNLIYPQNSTIRYKTMLFPDGQPHIRLDMESIATLDKTQALRIITRLNNPNDLILLLLTKNSLDYLGFENTELYVSYLMAARMDRVMQDGEPFSLKVIAQIINQASFRKIKIFDPHSEVSTALIERSYAISNHQYIADVLQDYFQANGKTDFCIVSPDAGALKKIHQLAQYLDIENVVECMKERDVKTGRLISFKTIAERLDGLTCFIIDDICDGGGTFAGTARMLKDKGAARVVLIVSHGIFSKGTAIDFVDEVYTTDSFREVSGIHCYSVARYLQ